VCGKNFPRSAAVGEEAKGKCAEVLGSDVCSFIL